MTVMTRVGIKTVVMGCACWALGIGLGFGGWTVIVRIVLRLFGHLSDSGLDETRMEVLAGETVATLAERLSSTHPKLAKIGRCRAAVNLEYVERSTLLEEGDEVAFIPPMSGGCPEDRS